MYEMAAGRNACLTMSVYGIPTYSTIRNAAAPITGGMIWPLIEEDASIAPAFTPERPDRFISGIVKMPPETTLDTDEPDTTPRSEEHTSELQSQSNLVCRL